MAISIRIISVLNILRLFGITIGVVNRFCFNLIKKQYNNSSELHFATEQLFNKLDDMT